MIMSKLISVSLTARQWNVLEVSLDRFIEDQFNDGSDESIEYGNDADLVKTLMQHELKKVESYYG
tara:strand:+ start:2226 stop:2420 length:195 start_codon:yes stop_codon:yes gene_type:complete